MLSSNIRFFLKSDLLLFVYTCGRRLLSDVEEEEEKRTGGVLLIIGGEGGDSASSPFPHSSPVQCCPVAVLLVVWLDPNSQNLAAALPQELSTPLLPDIKEPVTPRCPLPCNLLEVTLHRCLDVIWRRHVRHLCRPGGGGIHCCSQLLCRSEFCMKQYWEPITKMVCQQSSEIPLRRKKKRKLHPHLLT